MDELLALTLDLITNARRQTLGGREYLVADAVILKQAVLHGSDGPLFYPRDEISTNIGGWNGFPLTARHPFVVVEGTRVDVSARIPEIADRFQIGTVYNDRMVGDERWVQPWFDVQVCNRIDPRIIPAIESGKKVNVSTGLFLQKVKSAEGAVFNGVKYTHTVRNLRPDHLAVLIDDRGACSTDDGCGINVRNSLETPTVNKTQLIDWLVTNCSCWKGDAGKTTLNTLDETQLTEIKTNAEKAKVADPLVEIVKNLSGKVGFKDSDPRKLTDFVVNALGEKDQAIEAAKKTVVVTNTSGDVTEEQVLNALKNLTAEKRLDLVAPAGSKERQFLDTAKQVHEERRIEVIRKLTANIADETERKAKILKLKDKDLPTLNEYLEFAVSNAKTEPAKDDSEEFLRNFFGQQGAANNQPAPTGNGGGGYGPGRVVGNRKNALPPYPVLSDDTQAAG